MQAGRRPRQWATRQWATRQWPIRQWPIRQRPIRQRVLGAVLGAAGLAVALTACSSSGIGPGTGPRSAPPAPVSVSSAHGLVVCQPASNNTAIELEVISPQNLRVEASTMIPAVPGQEQTSNVTSGPNAPLGCSQIPQQVYGSDVPAIGPEEFAARQRFNANFTELAVLIQKPSSNTADAGYLDLATGKVTDLTSASTSSGFGSSSATAQDALFSPATGDLWYLASNGTPYSLDASGHATAHPVGYASSLQCCSGDQPGFISLAPQTNWVLSDTGTGLPSPSGTVAVGPATADSGGQIQIWHQGSDLTAEADILGGDQSKDISAINVQGLPSAETSTTTGAAAIAWLSDTRLILLWNNQFYILTFNAGYTSATAGPGLLPSSSNQFLQAMLSPDHQTLAFIANTGGSADYLYEMALDQPGAQPKKIGQLGASGTPWAILAWR
jgi:hypothetical protein